MDTRVQQGDGGEVETGPKYRWSIIAGSGYIYSEGAGVPLRYRTRPALEALIKPFGMIRRVISEGLIEGDPNIVLVEAEGPMGSTPPATIRLRGLQGIFGILLSTRLQPSLPATHSKLGAAEDGREKDIAVTEVESNIR